MNRMAIKTWQWFERVWKYRFALSACNVKRRVLVRLSFWSGENGSFGISFVENQVTLEFPSQHLKQTLMGKYFLFYASAWKLLSISTRTNISQHYQKSTLTFRSRDEELTTGRGTGCEIIPLSCSLAGKRESSHCCQKLSDRKSVIRETRDDVIRTSSLSREKVHSSLKQTFFCWIKKSRYFSSSTSLSPTATKKIKQPAETQLFRLNLIMSSGPLIKYSQKD